MLMKGMAGAECYPPNAARSLTPRKFLLTSPGDYVKVAIQIFVISDGTKIIRTSIRATRYLAVDNGSF